jgi:flagellin
MSLVVTTNMASLITQNYLSQSQNNLQSADTQLASGLRINNAADDAAGYSISQRMTVQINGDNTAIQNTNNAVSLAQTAEGSLAQITANLQSVSQLAVEAANATNSASDRQSLNNEAQQLLQEVDRVASTASFNGINLLDGSFSGQQFQVGANAGDTISMGAIASVRTSDIGTATVYTATSAVPTTAIAAGGDAATGGMTINGISIGASASASAADVSAAINAAGAGVTASVQSDLSGTAAGTDSGTLAGNDLVINGVAVDGSFTTGAGLASLINSQVTGVTASVSSGGVLSLTAANGATVSATVSANGDTLTGLNGGTGSAGTVSATGNQVAITSSSAFSVQVGNKTTSATSSGGFAAAASGTSGTDLVSSIAATSVTTGAALSTLDLSSVSGATAALTAIQNALNSVDTTNATLGAYQNRFQSAVQTLQTGAQNLTAARSTIEDANYASATAAETSASVLQQAGIAVLGQANSQPQQILSLLQHL